MPQVDHDLPVAILAGGLATRLRPLTEKIPKILLEVGGKPFLEHQLANLRRQGIREIVLCVGFLGESIQERYGNGNHYGVHLSYCFDGPKLLGTGGAIRRALHLLGDAFFVLYGDSYLEIDFDNVKTAFFQSECSALMTVLRNRNQWDSSNVEFADGRILVHDKSKRSPAMQYIYYGFSIFKSSVFDGYEEGSSLDLAEMTRDLALRGDLAGYETTKRFYEIGSHAGLAELDGI